MSPMSRYSCDSYLSGECLSVPSPSITGPEAAQQHVYWVMLPHTEPMLFSYRKAASLPPHSLFPYSSFPSVSLYNHLLELGVMLYTFHSLYSWFFSLLILPCNLSLSPPILVTRLHLLSCQFFLPSFLVISLHFFLSTFFIYNSNFEEMGLWGLKAASVREWALDTARGMVVTHQQKPYEHWQSGISVFWPIFTNRWGWGASERNWNKIG